MIGSNKEEEGYRQWILQSQSKIRHSWILSLLI